MIGQFSIRRLREEMLRRSGEIMLNETVVAMTLITVDGRRIPLADGYMVQFEVTKK